MFIVLYTVHLYEACIMALHYICTSINAQIWPKGYILQLGVCACGIGQWSYIHLSVLNSPSHCVFDPPCTFILLLFT
jgi:hypothetical protein